MTFLVLAMILAVLTACTATPMIDPEAQNRVNDAATSGQIRFDQSVDVTPNGVIFAGSEQTPGLASSSQVLFWRCFGGGFEGGWQDQGCFPAIPVYNGSVFEGYSQALPPDGIFRLACAREEATERYDDPAWCRHWVGLDSPEEEEWIVWIDEQDPETGDWIQKVNICVQMINGVAYPAEAECASLHVEP